MNDQPTDYSSIDSFHVGRRRKPNFTEHEVLNIIDQYDTYKELLHSREASKSVIAQKQAIWKQITDNLNATYPQVERTVDDVRRKWKKLQSEAKREVAANRAAQASGTTTSISNKQLNLYNRILSICRPSSISSHFPHGVLQHQQVLQQQSNINNTNHDISFNEQSSDKVDSPSSDLANGVSGQLDSPGDESASLLGNDDNSRSPITNFQITSNIPSQQINTLTIGTSSNGGQISKRTLDKRRKLLKSSINQQLLNNTNKSYGQQQHSLRYESLIKRKRTLELISQKLLNDKQVLLIEKKNLDIKLATNECENKRIAIDKRRIELALQKFQCELPLSANGNNNNLSDQEDHDDNDSLDDMSDFNE
ncbi:unnamed protein product [Rotaria sordida]|uniref:Myb/SANT-like DNA-binding domain-containing protein n=1 Tax=Rotaria sordida TaxID=392033 RepID=A0A814CCM2_9BILA|nr:unnamed protein product [Rotaria sordida]CAF0892833.1 unnamed protein product [Rotaria sordida]CAF0905477.1 unnamed protein product [Rotaria sordida]CAF0921634.1 unnamed protein product [Rotaria sordida]CAF0926750.1 unnamed protein product [Rotaria sordida]